MKLVVVGDSLLDVDVEGTADRLCPDAPAPVLDVVSEHARPGGAALAATMAGRDGVDVTLVSALSHDEAGERLRSLLDVPSLFGHVDSVPVKTRLRCAGTSLARLDSGGHGVPRVSDDMLDAVLSADVVLASDYGRGLLRDERLRSVLSRVPVVWDPHPRGPAPVPGVRLATPNLAEARAFSGLADPYEAGRALLSRWRARAVVVTLGGDGALLHRGSSPVAVPAPPVQVQDPCGAGDRFAVTAAVRLASGAAADEAVADAVRDAAGFLARGGLSGPRSEAPSTVDEVRSRGGVVVATGGCFDVLHAGHVRMLAAARALGDCLVVCLNSDRSVRRLKGDGRPVNGEADRAEVLRALASVDDVVVFSENSPENVLRQLRPDVWVKGGDYTAELMPETAVVSSWGGRTAVVPYHRGRSTTEILTRRT
ncbi:D-glycero-beta-D-manno-heptose 1-phosphate adenylyltransferase [Lentzea sp. NBRC 102530]|uniref:D-glycero-beta-D-manno-heptose 1-phosphate adenylyltransferase n=1 Tax=Lentzea sp. NBRC 102530 TaxID=3032201 RepID=UPI0025527F22|nr:D-glycero-beta-D-manno-heptose 1-phosphate adenylyltransferase [Lentzea sp. NBRC 102530]